MEPKAVTWAVLGLLAQRPRSGYEIKQAVDRTIRHFWAASYGQIYPELRQLEAAGWIQGADGSRGARSKRVYTITAEGQRGDARVARRSRDTHRAPRRTRCCASSSPTCSLPSRRSDCWPHGARATAPCSSTCARSTPTSRARSDVRRPRLSLGPGLLRMGSRGATARNVACAGPPRGSARADVAVDAPARTAAVRRRGRRAGPRLLRRVEAVGARTCHRRLDRRVPRAGRVGAAARPRPDADRRGGSVRRDPGPGRARRAQHNRVPRATGRPERALGPRLLRLDRDRPAAGRRVRRRLVPVSRRSGPARTYRREFGMQSFVWGLVSLARAALRLWALLDSASAASSSSRS